MTLLPKRISCNISINRCFLSLGHNSLVRAFEHLLFTIDLSSRIQLSG